MTLNVRATVRGAADRLEKPQATAETIVGRIKAVFPAKLSNRIVAQHTLSIFENLNARPPGVLASIGFGLLQFGTIGATAVIAAVIFIGSRNAALRPLDPATISVVQTPGDSALALPHNVIVAGFDTPDKLLTAISALARTHSREMAVARFGQHVLIAQLIEDVDGLRATQTSLEKLGASVLVSTPSEPLTMRLSCKPTSAAAGKALDRELGGYFLGRGLNLLPPWAPHVSWTPVERVRFGKARDTYQTISHALANAQSDPAVFSFVKRAQPVYDAGDTAGMARLEVERVALFARVRRAHLLALRQDPVVDTAVVNAYITIEEEADSTTQRARRTALVGPLLGQLPLADGQPLPGAADWSVAGFVDSRGKTLDLPSLRFVDAFQGPPAVARWLLANGCRDVRYAFMNGSSAKVRAAGSRSPRLLDRE